MIKLLIDKLQREIWFKFITYNLIKNIKKFIIKLLNIRIRDIFLGIFVMYMFFCAWALPKNEFC